MSAGIKSNMKVSYQQRNLVRYNDLDNDGESEKLTFMDKDNAYGLMITNKSGFVEQWNVRGNFGFHLKDVLYISGDYNSDGISEVYFFSLSGDSVLLHSIPDFRKPDFGLRNHFVAKVGPGIKAPDPIMIKADMDDLDHDGRKELIFGIGTGFSLYPRGVFAYFIDKDSMIKSPESCSAITKILQADIDNDGFREIIPYGGAPSNCDNLSVKYHDNSCWLMILDSKLNFKYPPVEFKGRYSSFCPMFSQQW